MFSRFLTQVSHINLSLFSTQYQRKCVSYRLLHFLFISSLTHHALLSISLSFVSILVMVSVTTFLV
ncbi:unnamed protein product [Hymenolepis diminuta]|uniref:Uncharacterized protein n=1 Tax=Hymenolepis diminuta TaxID=6216 RepID=A0A564YH72_HYMDI|nr:unnamed protein product [Hymenolepis diminuta]